NRANPEDFNLDMEWGWRTEFTDLGAVTDISGDTQLKAQAVTGRTRMGFPMNGRRWVDNRFRSAYVMLVHAFGQVGVSARFEGIDPRHGGGLADDDYDETGWSAMLAGKREWGPVTGLIEWLHVSSRREDREEVGLEPRQRQTQLQGEVRIRW